MKIVVLDGRTLNPGDNPWDPVKDALAVADEFILHDKTEPTDTLERCMGAQVLLTNKTVLTGPMLEKLPEVKLICVLATGVNTVDIDAAKRLGITVSNVPEYGTNSVAQFVMAQILYFSHRVALHDQRIREGTWAQRNEFCFWDTPQTELAGKSLGIIGYGRIGQATAKLAEAFQMKVLVYSPSGKSRDEFVNHATLDTVLRESDYLSLHCVLNDQTEEIINKQSLSKMKKGAYLINTARGSLVDEQALADALQSGSLGGAALDVVPQEPIPSSSPLLKAPNLLLTPHMAWSSVQARKRLMQTTADNIRAFLSNQPQNAVT